MSLLPGLEAELLGAARRTAPSAAPVARAAQAARARPSGRTRRGGRRGRYGLFALVGVLAFSGGAYAARGVWQPVLGSGEGSRPVATRQAPSTRQLDLLGVLRRPQTDADRGAASSAALRGFRPREGEIRTAWVRRLATLPNGSVAVLVPVHQKHPTRHAAFVEGAGAQLCLAIVPTRGAMDPPTCGQTWQVLVGGGLSAETRDPFTPRQERDRAAAIRRGERAGDLPRPGSAKRWTDVDREALEAVDRATYSSRPRALTRTYSVNVVPDIVARVRFFEEPGRPEVAVRGNVVVRQIPAGQVAGSTSWLDDQGRPLNADGVRVAPSPLVP